MQFKFILPVSTKFLCSVCFLTRPVFGHVCDYIAHTKKQHNMATPSMTLKLGGFQHGDGVFHIKALAFARPRHGLRSAMFLTAHVLSLIVPQPSELLLAKWPIMAFCSIRQAYRPPLLVWFYKPRGFIRSRDPGSGTRLLWVQYPTSQKWGHEWINKRTIKKLRLTETSFHNSPALLA